MKIYTEEQVRQIINRAELNRHLTYGDVLDGIFPIELPSDEEILSIIQTSDLTEYDDYFEDGAKWMRDKIINK